MLKYQRRLINSKIIAGTICIFILILFSSGCVSDSIVPEINPNPTENSDNSTVSYIKVTTSSSTIKVNQSLEFVVKGYNSDDEWVILDKSKIILWKWTVSGCPVCIAGLVSLSPTSNSLTTTFSSGASGKFYIGAYYKEDAEAEIKSGYMEVQVSSKVKTIYDINPEQ